MNDPIKTQFTALREAMSSLNIKTKKREQILEMLLSLEVCPSVPFNCSNFPSEHRSFKNTVNKRTQKWTV